MKKPLPIPVIVGIAVCVVIVGWFAFSKMSADPVVTGTKTGYDPQHLPPPPSFKIPPPPAGAAGAGGAMPPPAGVRPDGA